MTKTLSSNFISDWLDLAFLRASKNTTESENSLDLELLPKFMMDLTLSHIKMLPLKSFKNRKSKKLSTGFICYKIKFIFFKTWESTVFPLLFQLMKQLTVLFWFLKKDQEVICLIIFKQMLQIMGKKCLSAFSSKSFKF